MAVAVLKLPHWSQLSVAVLLTPVSMCSSGAIRGAKNVVVGNVRHHIQVIGGQKPLGILSGENVDSYGGAECYPPYVPLP